MASQLYEITSADGAFPITLKVKSQGLTRKFFNAKEATAFFEEQDVFWTELSGTAGASNSWTSNGHGIYGAAALEVARRVNQNVRQNGSPATIIGSLEELANNVGTFAGSSRAKFLERIAAEVPDGLPYLPIIFGMVDGSQRVSRLPSPSINAYDVIAMGAAIVRYFEDRGKTEPQRQQLQEMIASVEETLQATRGEVAKFSDWSGNASDAVDKLKEQTEKTTKDQTDFFRQHLQRHLDAIDKRLQDVTAQFEAFRQASEEEIAGFKQKVRQDVLNEVPTTFWNRKANWHYGTAALFGALFVGAVGIGIWWVDAQALDLIAAGYTKLSAAGANPNVVALAPIALLSIPALGFAWVLRHISRLITQNVALGADSRLRGTITSTFRALASDRAMTDAELALVLQALFRPIDGKDHTEIAPPSISEILKMDK
jgi:hypothetical protein